jgi:leucyl aminopeptidase
VDIRLASESATDVETDAVVVGCYKNQGLSEVAKAVDRATGGVLERLLGTEEITGKHAELTTLLVPGGVKTGRVVVVGLGEFEDFDRGAAFRAVSAAAKHLAEKQRQTVAFYVEDRWPEDVVESAVCGALVGCQGQDLYRAEKKLFPFSRVLWNGTQHQAVDTGRILAESVNLARRLVNQPASEIFPDSFAKEAEPIAQDAALSLEIWDEQRLQAERCGALLAVGRGSAHPPRLVILEHRGAGTEKPPLALVGKGVTFDAGGLSLKPTDGMKTMKCDMAGAATVVAAMRAIAKLEVPANVIGIVGLVENMVSGSSYKLGDVLTARSGKTIEVLNTDAEGRLVLADALDVAVERGAERIVDVATLTGACMIALGTDVAGVMANDQTWCDSVAAAARICGEPAWQLPMFAEFGEQVQSKVADIKNVGEGRWGGAITAAKFLEEFVQEKPWVHIDIAGPAFLDNAKPWIDAGATGCFVRTLVELTKNYAN